MLSVYLMSGLPAWLCFCYGFASVVLGDGFPVIGGVGGPFVKCFYVFSRMVSCVDHFGNVILGWVSGV